jgi:small subunit ribosomal protein S20
MPNTKSAKKALRASTRKREFNVVRKFKIKNSLKELRKALTTNPEEYQKSLSKVFSSLDKAVKSNLLHKNTAARKKSRMSLLVAKTLGNKNKSSEK